MMAGFGGSPGGPAAGLTDTGKIKIWALVRDTYGILRKNSRFLVRIAAVPAGVAFVLLRLSYLALPETADLGRISPEQLIEQGGAFFAAALAVNLIMAVLTAAYAVSCHRLVLMGPGAVPRLGIDLGRREGRFILVWIIIMVLMFLISIVPVVGMAALMGLAQEGESAPLALLTILAAAAVIILIYSIFFRFALALPATAADAPGGLADRIKDSWRLTKGTALRIFWAILLAGLLLFIPVLAATGAVLLIRDLPGGISIELALNVVFSYLGAALLAAMLSLAYQRLAGLSPPPE